MSSLAETMGFRSTFDVLNIVKFPLLLITVFHTLSYDTGRDESYHDCCYCFNDPGQRRPHRECRPHFPALIIGGDIIPMGSKQYVVGIRSSPNSPIHVLTSSICTKVQGPLGPNYASVGSHYLNQTGDGEQITIVKTQNHTMLNTTSSEFPYDFGNLILETPSKIPPANLPFVDDSQIKRGMLTKVMGWGTTAEFIEETADLVECMDLFAKHGVDDADSCAGGQPGKGFEVGDFGAPLVLENGLGDSDDVLIGVVGHFGLGGQAGVPTASSRVSVAME
ncbi:putative serine protease, trypsin domain, peptidase S1, PA clan [Plasmopara halstedii]